MGGNSMVWIGLAVGSTIGSMIPSLWGGGIFSISSIFFSGVGGCTGIYLGWKISQNF